MAAAMNCEEATDLLALDAVGGLEPQDRAEIERHLSTCAACRQRAAQYADVASLLPAALDQVQPPARLRRNLMAQVYAESSTPAALPWWRRLYNAIPSGRAITVAGAVAVVAAVVFAIWGATGRNTEQAVAYMVSGTTATGTLDVSGGTQGVLSVQGLNPLPATEVYEVWLIPRQGSPKGVAFLSPGPNGGPWTAVMHGNMAAYKSVAATIEPAGGSPTPSTTVVLSGQLGES
ncbi:MAG TPA: anti-sigma factor [Candidatus Acidoferrales bacterium]|nr:anti-sigma factor [Candidatus Acidoferrales bacterium]